MFVVMNRISVHAAYADAFIERFSDRAALVDNMPGFVSFRLLRPTSEGQPFIVETTWENEESFQNWTQSDEFKQGHAKAGQLPPEAFAGHPQLELLHVVQEAERGNVFASSEETGATKDQA